MKTLSTLSIALTLAATASLAAAQSGSHGAHAGHEVQASAQAPAATELAEGEVKKIDKEAGKITLRHGELKNLNMAAMTMVFRVKHPAMLEQVKVGDKLRFAVERVNGALTIVELHPAK